MDYLQIICINMSIIQNPNTKYDIRLRQNVDEHNYQATGVDVTQFQILPWK